MTDPWLALAAGSDPAERIRTVGRAHERFLAGDPAPDPVRDVVAASWRRSAVLLGPDGDAPIELADAELAAYRAAHPLARVLPLFRDLLGGLADDGAHIMAVCDARGRLLWVEGTAGVLRGAERMNFVPGARWDEAHAGTNAPGTALAVDHCVQIMATEHFRRGVQRWTCAAAPVHDPATGLLLGAVDVTGGDHLANPHSLALVRATALAAEAYLAARTPPGPAAVTADVLGRDEAVLHAGGRRIRLGRRHSELLVLLLAHPGGRTGEQLAADLYPDDASPVTVRAELSRLRRILGPDLLDSRPYRLRVPVEADLTAVRRLAESGRVADALAGYRGPLLPASEAPGVVRLRRALDDELRTAALAAADPAVLRGWLRTPAGADDLAAWEAYAALLPPTSPARAPAAARIRGLAAEYGLPTAPVRAATSVQRRRR